MRNAIDGVKVIDIPFFGSSFQFFLSLSKIDVYSLSISTPVHLPTSFE